MIESKEIHQATALVQARADGGLDQGGSGDREG